MFWNGTYGKERLRMCGKVDETINLSINDFTIGWERKYSL
jgi:hypothetical protein